MERPAPEESDSSANTDPSDVPGDAELIAATRAGDTTAFGELYQRHVHAARRLSQVLVRDRAAADDLVSETFAKVLASLKDGRGPDLAFRAYLLTTLRNTCYDRARRDRKVEFTDDMTRHDPGEEFVDTAVAGQERRYAARAFGRLPERWQVVLWHTEVEGESAAEVAPLLGLTPNGVSALAYRARERLRQMYLQEHIADSPSASCQWTADRLGARVRGGLSTRDAQKVDDHLDDCTACKLLYMELNEVNSGLRGVLAPLVLGAAAPAYLAGGAAVKGGAVAFTWFTPIGDGIRQAADWVRRIAQRIGGRNAAIAGGTAVVAGALVLALVANNSAPPPDPPAQADEPPGTEVPSDDPSEPSDDPPTDDPPPIDVPDEEPPPDDEPEPTEPVDPELIVDADPSSSDLIAGDSGTLPITIDASEDTAGTSQPVESGRIPPAALRTADEAMTLDIELPDGMTSPGGDAQDGWSCEPSDAGASCQRERLEPGQATTAQVPVEVAPQLSGFQEIPVSVSGDGVAGEETLQVPVAPQGMRTAFASDEATAMNNAGNTFMSCDSIAACHGLDDNHLARMGPYTADGAPSGLDSDWAASGSELPVPAGSQVLYAGLHWAGSNDHNPDEVKFATPDGGWTTVAAENTWSGWHRPTAQASADVTDLIGQGGDFWVAADADSLPDDTHSYAGWSLTVVYDQPGIPTRDTAVYEGLAQPGSESAVSVGLPSEGDTAALYTLWDGDRTLVGDNLDIDGTELGTTGNVGHGRCPSALEGADWNTYGVDVDGGVAPNTAGSRLTLRTGLDPLDIGVLAVSSREY